VTGKVLIVLGIIALHVAAFAIGLWLRRRRRAMAAARR
jgi:hypothetical protein